MYSKYKMNKDVDIININIFASDMNTNTIITNKKLQNFSVPIAEGGDYSSYVY